MSEAGTVQRQPSEQAYFSTAHALGTGTTSTQALMVWRALNEHLINRNLPMTGAELVEATGLTMDYIADMFEGDYYRRHYGYRRFETLEAWRSWAEEIGLVYVPGKHGVAAASDDLDEADDEIDEDEDEDEAETED